MVKFTELQLLVLEKSEIDCADVEMLFDDYVSNDLPESLKDRLGSHIAECDDCQLFEEEYRLVIELAAEIGAESEAAPPAVHNRLRDSLNERLGLSLGQV